MRCLATWSNNARIKPYSYVGVWEIKTKVYKGRSRYPGVRLKLKPTIISCAVEMCHTVTTTKLLVKTEGCIADSGRVLISCISEQRHAVLTMAHQTVVLFGNFKSTFKYAVRWFSHLLMLLLLLWQLPTSAPSAPNPWCNMLLKIALHTCGKASASFSVQWKSASFGSLENLQ